MTVTTAVAAVNSVPLACTVAVPGATPVTGTLADIPPAAKNTVAGTVAIAGLEDASSIVSPAAGAAADSLRTRFFVSLVATDSAFESNASAAVTRTGTVRGA
jgi:hypothetical protein